MRLLLTNDDGITADGLAALVEAVQPFGKAVVVAPDRQHSMRSHAISAEGPLRAVPDPRFANAWCCTGTPADCVRLGLRALADGPFDVVLAGINHGGNLGIDVYYSGTVAAAREAAILGVPAVACSKLFRPEVTPNWPAAVSELRATLQRLWNDQPPRAAGLLTNINLPDHPAGTQGTVECPLETAPLPADYERDATDPHAHHYVGRYFDRPARVGSDVAAAFGGWITITRLRLDLTA